MKKITPQHNILFVTQDAGGFQAVVPVYRRLQRDRRFRVQGVFGNIVRLFPTAKGLALSDPKNVTDKQIASLFHRFHPSLVVTGPSAGLSLDKRALIIAQTLGIPTLTILDFCSNYDVLFGAPKQRKPVVADVVCVLNEMCRRELITWGIPAKQLIATGSPAFDGIKTAPASRRKKNEVLFVCQPFTELERFVKGSGFGLDERRVFADVVSALESISSAVRLTVRWHPRTVDRKKFDAIVESSDLDIRFDDRTPLATVLDQSSVVVGMNSTALLEAVLRGAPMISYQPGLRGQDPLPTDRWGITHRVATLPALTHQLKQMLAGSSKAISRTKLDKIIPRRATEHVLKVISTLLEI